MDNKLIETMLNHRSIRKWKDEKLSEDVTKTLIEVANRTSTSNGLLQASVILITDQEKRNKLAEIAKQPYLATSPELLIFIADSYRNSRVLEEASVDNKFVSDGDRFLQGITDAAIMAQNVANAAESMGLGIVYFGSILNDPRATIKLLGLPEKTMPVVGIGIGLPDQEPQLKPRIHIESRVFENEYKIFENYHEELKEYDEEMLTYYDLRDANKKRETFTQQLKEKLAVQRKLRAEYFTVAREQGYDL